MSEASNAYLDVTFTKSIQIKGSSCTDVSGNFKLMKGNDDIDIISSQVIGNKVRLLLEKSQIPKTAGTVKLWYTDNSGGLGCSLVDSTTGFPVSDLEPVKDAFKEEEETPQFPSITGASVKHETPNKITLTFTEKRDISNNSQSDAGNGSYGITITSSLGSSGAYALPVFNGVVNSGGSAPDINKIVLDSSGGLQHGSTISLTGGGIDNGLGDQFDLSCVAFTSFPVTNNVEQVILDGAYILNSDPSAVLLYFKKGTSGDILDMSAATIDSTNIYKIKIPKWNASTVTHDIYDVSGVDEISYSNNELVNAGFSQTLANRYNDISGVRMKMNIFPFRYNFGTIMGLGQADYTMMWDLSGGVVEKDRIEDKYGNDVFNSWYDPPNNVRDSSYVPITTNMIKGITIKTDSLSVNESTSPDLSYNIILSFVTQDLSATDISGSLVNGDKSHFKLKKNGTEIAITDIKEISDPSRVLIWVDYSKDTFDNIINVGDTITLSYQPPGNENIFGAWPTSIKDEYGNYVPAKLDSTSNNVGTIPSMNQNLSVTNNMDPSGILPTTPVQVDSTGKVINIACGFDISVNSTDEINGTGGFTINVADPTGIQVSKVEKGADDQTIKLTLDNSLYATSVPTFDYSNSPNINSTVTDCWGIKLKDASNIQINVSLIPAPGNDNEWTYNSGWYNEMGKLDLSFNPTITSFSEDDRSGFKYQASYTQHNSTFVDLSTNGFVDIPVSNVTFHDNIITLDTGFNQSGASRGFSKKHTSGGDYSIKVKYVGPDLSSNRPKGALGYLPDFEFTMADASNNIWDPSCNPVQDVSKTAIILHDNPSQILVAMQQPAYDGQMTQGNLDLKWWDISNILFANDPTLEYDDGAAITSSSTAVSRTVGQGGSSGHSSTTNWINATFPVDISSSTINVDWALNGTITDQNGGVLPAFDNKLPVTSYVNWIELDGTGGGNTQCNFEQTPIVYPFIPFDNPKQIHIQWDPTLSDYGGMTASAFKAKYNSYPGDTNFLEQVCTSFGSMSPPNSTENRLVLTFGTEFPGQADDIKIQYTKPVGNAGIKLNYDSGRWLESFDYKPAAGIRLNVPPSMTIESTTAGVTDGSTTTDASIVLKFTVTGTNKKTKTFGAGDITVDNGVISNFTATNADGFGWATEFTATFTPTQDGACTIDVGAGAFADIEGDGNSAATQFNWTKTTSAGFAFQASSSEWSPHFGESHWIQTALKWEQDISFNNGNPTNNDDFKSQFTGKFTIDGTEHTIALDDTGVCAGVLIDVYGRLIINWNGGGTFEMANSSSTVQIEYDKSITTSANVTNDGGDAADETTGFETISFEPVWTSAIVTNAAPKRIYFTMVSEIDSTSLPDKDDFTFSDMTPNAYGTSSFDNWTNGAVTGWTNGNNSSEGFYYEGGNEWQFGASGKVAYSGNMLYDMGPESITNNVETPFYSTNIGGQKISWIDKDEPYSVYMTFRYDGMTGYMANPPSLKEGNWSPNATYDTARINRTKNFKFITTNNDEPNKINIIDVSRVSIVNVASTHPSNEWGWDISMVKFDLSRNSNDISNVNNPYSFTQRDNIHMLWDYSDFHDDYRFADSSGNEVFDSSANVNGINVSYNSLANDMSGNIDETTFTGGWMDSSAVRWHGTPPNYFGALTINNIIQDISMVSGSVGTTGEANNEILEIVFQNDVSFNSSIMTSINTDDWQVDISNASTSGWDTLLDASKNTLTIGTNKLEMSFTPSTGIFQHGDEIKINLNSMNNKPLSRQYIDISGNKLIPYNISNDGTGTLVTNNIAGAGTPTLLSVTVATSNPRKAIFKFSEAVSDPSGNIDISMAYVGEPDEHLFYSDYYSDVNDAPWAIYVEDRKSWQTSEPYWKGNFTAINADGNGRATEWYLFAEGGGETQFDSSFNVVYNNTNDTAENASGTKVDSTSIQATINVITPYYTKNWDKGSGVDVSSSWIDKDEPNSVYMWFRDASNNANIRDLSDNGNNINTGIDGGHRYLDRYKFVTKNKDAAAEGYPTNIIDVSKVTFLTLPASSSKNPMGVDISAVRFDLSRNESSSADISNAINPYSFTSRDEIYMWWQTNNISDDGRLRDLISDLANGNGNEIWDSSANKTGYMTNDVNAAVDISGLVSSTTRPNDGDNNWMHDNTFHGLEINNQIRDIQVQSVEISGNETFSDGQHLIIRFQNDISFNYKWTDGSTWSSTDISACDWIIEISGNRPSSWNSTTVWDSAFNGQWVDISYAFGASNGITRDVPLEGFPISTRYAVFGDPDISYNAINLLPVSESVTTNRAGIKSTDDVRIALKNMDNKPLGRQYTDISGNKLVAKTGVNYVGSNAAYFTQITNNLLPSDSFVSGSFTYATAGIEATVDISLNWYQDISSGTAGGTIPGAAAFYNQFTFTPKNSGTNVTGGSGFQSATVNGDGDLILTYGMFNPSDTPDSTSTISYTGDGTYSILAAISSGNYILDDIPTTTIDYNS